MMQKESSTQSDTRNISVRSSLITIGTVVFVGVHGAMLLSIPSVLRSRGAPFLPTFQRDLDAIFQIIRCHQSTRPLHPRFTFMDLGSGDGRLVFRAARENMFRTCLGYEINPGTFG
jgi:hypothetical protein